MKLTTDQENIIKTLVDNQKLTIKTLSDDITDHLCCVVESQLGKGKSFDDLLNNALMDLAPNGLIEIQHKTIFLLNSKRIILMKRLMYLIGFIGSITLTAGITFKLLHMPFGTELFTIGFLTLLLIFIPLVTFNRYKVAISKSISVKLKMILGAIASIITGLSGLFKLMHLQGAELLLILGAFIFGFGFLPFYFFTMYKKSVS